MTEQIAALIRNRIKLYKIGSTEKVVKDFLKADGEKMVLVKSLIIFKSIGMKTS